MGEQGPALQCAVYRSSRKRDTYLFVEREDDFSCVPETLLQLVGHLDLVMKLELNEDRKLAQADVGTVIRSLRDSGYYLQLPPVLF